MNYKELYQEKLVPAKAVAERIEDGWTVCTDIAAAIPPAIVNALGEEAKAGRKKGITLHTLLDLSPFSFLEEEAAAGIRPVSWFSGKGLAKAVNDGRADVMSCYYMDIPSLFTEYIDIDALVLVVAPMDRHGWFSAGITGSVSEALIRKAKHIYVEVNENMPRAFSAPMVHISQIDAVCEFTQPLPIMPPAKLDDISRTIGGLIAAEVPDGACLQLGIGAVPEAVGLALKDKKDLGIHTELFTDSMVELIECGAVTNEKKELYRGKTVATFAFGSQRLYDYINDNPSFMVLPVDQVNTSSIVAQLSNFISVNAALEVDFFGQVCAESIGTKHVSGSGGQVDYVRGAVLSPGGKSFIAFPSTALGGKVSRIKPTLTEGAIVTTSKNDVDHIVTEYGIAKLRGKTLSQRVKAMIAIAHPDFRDELTFEAKKRNIII